MPYAELLLRRERDRKPYRLKARIVTGPYPSPGELQLAIRRGLEMFVADLEKQGWTWLPNVQHKLTGPYVPVRTQIIHRPLTLSAAQMMPYVMRGIPLPTENGTSALMMPILEEQESWEYELSLTFIRPQIMTEIPDAHEVEHR